MKKPIAFMTAMILLAAGSAPGDDLVENGDFDTSVAFWGSTAMLVHVTGAACPDGACAELEGDDPSAAGTGYATQCIDASGLTLPDEIVYGGSFVAVNYTPTGNTLGLQIGFHDNANCSSEVSNSTTAGGFQAGQGVWYDVRRAVDISGLTVNSIFVRAGALAELSDSTEARLDGIYIIPGDIFADDFETGSPGEWSSVVP